VKQLALALPSSAWTLAGGQAVRELYALGWLLYGCDLPIAMKNAPNRARKNGF